MSSYDYVIQMRTKIESVYALKEVGIIRVVSKQDPINS